MADDDGLLARVAQLEKLVLADKASIELNNGAHEALTDDSFEQAPCCPSVDSRATEISDAWAEVDRLTSENARLTAKLDETAKEFHLCRVELYKSKKTAREQSKATERKEAQLKDADSRERVLVMQLDQQQRELGRVSAFVQDAQAYIAHLTAEGASAMSALSRPYGTFGRTALSRAPQFSAPWP